MCQKRVLFVFRENYSMINSRVALRVVIPAQSTLVAPIFWLTFLTFDADKLWGPPPWPLGGSGQG